MSERERMLTPKQAENILASMLNDLAWLYDDEINKSGPYRWAVSGLSRVKSHNFENVSRGGSTVELDDGERIEVTQIEGAAFRGSASKVRRAGWLINDAQKCLARARRLLTVDDRRPAEDGPVLPGWVSQKEREVLLQNQRERQRRGTGYGDA